jgi:glycine dehydrogenase subunit 2
VSIELEPFLPVPRVVKTEGVYRLDTSSPDSIGRVHGFFGNVSILVRAYSYILSMGGKNLKKASQLAVLNGVYVRELLRDTFKLAYDRPCMHESVFSDKYQQPFKITTLDMAKRLIDYGFHPPTIYFPLVVPGAIMIEPTETECKEDLDRFAEVFKEIAREAQADAEQLRQAPTRTKVRRLDETLAARKPCLRG